MTRTFKALSALLAYPDEELRRALPDIRAAIAREALVPAALLRPLDRLIESLAADDLYDLEERYHLLFERTRSLSLHLFEHVHGESRDRGQAMVDLRNLYERHGLAIAAAELPDYLPLFLEFLATRPLAEARELLAQPAHILLALAERLRKRGSPYEAVFRALVALAGAVPEDLPAEEDEAGPDDLAALDAQWEDAPVTFGPDASPSCKDRLVARMRAARRTPA